MPTMRSAYMVRGALRGAGRLVSDRQYVNSPRAVAVATRGLTTYREPDLSSAFGNFIFNACISSTNSREASTNDFDPQPNFNICVFAQVRKKW